MWTVWTRWAPSRSLWMEIGNPEISGRKSMGDRVMSPHLQLTGGPTLQGVGESNGRLWPFWSCWRWLFREYFWASYAIPSLVSIRCWSTRSGKFSGDDIQPVTIILDYRSPDLLTRRPTKAGQPIHTDTKCVAAAGFARWNCFSHGSSRSFPQEEIPLLASGVTSCRLQSHPKRTFLRET